MPAASDGPLYNGRPIDYGYECSECGAWVANTATHTAWHGRLQQQAPSVGTLKERTHDG